jgi:hypothetical protein
MQDLQVCDPSTYKPWEIGLRLWGFVGDPNSSDLNP